MPDDERPTLTVADVCDLAGGCSPDTVYRAVNDGALVGYRLGNLKFYRADVAAWIESRRVKPKRGGRGTKVVTHRREPKLANF